MAITLPSPPTVLAMLRACTDHSLQLKSDGCADGVALDRTWDAYTCALKGMDVHCADPRDRLFENKLRTIRKRGTNA